MQVIELGVLEGRCSQCLRCHLACLTVQVRCRVSSIHIYVLFVILINRDDGKWMHFSDMDWRGGNARNKIFISAYWFVWVEGYISSLKLLEQWGLYIVCQIQLVHKLANFAMREWFGEEIGCVFVSFPSSNASPVIFILLSDPFLIPTKQRHIFKISVRKWYPSSVLFHFPFA